MMFFRSAVLQSYQCLISFDFCMFLITTGLPSTKCSELLVWNDLRLLISEYITTGEKHHLIQRYNAYLSI